MSLHEKEGEQEDAYTKTETNSYPHPYIFLCCLFVNILFKKVSICACSIFNNRYISERNKDVWMGNIVGLLKKKKKKKKKKKRKNMMMTQICEIACERILRQSTGGAYNTFRHVDNWILARE